MHDPKPIAKLLCLELFLLVLLALWWLNLTSGERDTWLAIVQEEERTATAHPAGFLAQAEWLYEHRWAQLVGMAGALLVAAMVGIGEGIAKRKRDVLSGFRLRWWTLAVVAMAVIPGLIAGYLFAPWPLSVPWVASGLATLTGFIGYSGSRGMPYVP